MASTAAGVALESESGSVKRVLTEHLLLKYTGERDTHQLTAVELVFCSLAGVERGAFARCRGLRELTIMESGGRTCGLPVSSVTRIASAQHFRLPHV